MNPYKIAVLCATLALLSTACSTQVGTKTSKTNPSAGGRVSPPASPADKAQATAVVISQADIPTWAATGTARTYDDLNFQSSFVTCVGGPENENYATADVIGQTITSPSSASGAPLGVTSRVRVSEKIDDVQRNTTAFQSAVGIDKCAQDTFNAIRDNVDQNSVSADFPRSLPDGTPVSYEATTSALPSPDGSNDATGWRITIASTSGPTTINSYTDFFHFPYGRADVFLIAARAATPPAANAERQLVTLLRGHAKEVLGDPPG